MFSIEQRDSDAASIVPRIFYELDFAHAARHLVEVTMTVHDVVGNPEFVLPAWVPGSYKIRDYISRLGSLVSENADGEALSYEWSSGNRFRVEAQGADVVVVRYNYYAAEHSVRHSYVGRGRAFLNPGNFLLYVDGRTAESHGLSIASPWSTVSTPLAPLAELATFGALNYDILVDSPIEIGDHEVVKFDVAASSHEIVLAPESGVDREWIELVCRRVVEQGLAFWGELPYDRYVFFLQFIPEMYGGLEHARAQVSVFDPTKLHEKTAVVRFLSLITHEFFHTWNVKRIRPIELGPFDYERENFTRMLWLAEGATSYFDDLLSYRTGFMTEKEYLKALARQHIGALRNVPGRHAMSVTDSSMLAWVRLYNQHEESINQFPSYYLKGGVIFLMLDLLIIEKSDGVSSLDEGMRAHWRRYKTDPAVGVTTDEFVAIVEEACGVPIRREFLEWLDSTGDLDVNARLATVGLGLDDRPEKPTTIGQGFPMPRDPKRRIGVSVSTKDGFLRVDRVLASSPAAAAGIGAGDLLISVNGERVTTPAEFLRRASTTPKPRIEGLNDGRFYSVDLEPENRPTWRLVERDDVDERGHRLRRIWLDGLQSA